MNVTLDMEQVKKWTENHPGEKLSQWLRIQIRNDNNRTEPLEARLSKYARIYPLIDDVAQLESSLKLWAKALFDDYGMRFTEQGLRTMLREWNPSPATPTPRTE